MCIVDAQGGGLWLWNKKGLGLDLARLLLVSSWLYVACLFFLDSEVGVGVEGKQEDGTGLVVYFSW